MGWWNQFTFVYPWLLPFAAVPVLLYLWNQKRGGERLVSLRLPSTRSVDGLSSWRSTLRPFLPLLRVAALVLMIVALARPRLDLSEESVTAEGIDIVLTMDLSTSMGAQDFDPNRLEVAKQVARDFVSRREYDRIGLVAYAGEAYTKAPLTVDKEIIDRFISELEMGEITDGTAIGLGLETAINRLKDSEAASKIIILLTDGENNAGDRHKPEVAAEIARQFGIRVYTIGVGSGEETLMPSAPIGGGRYRFKPTRGTVDDELLAYIAEETNGRYFRARDTEELESIYAYIDELEKTEIETTVFRRYEEQFARFLWLGFGLLLLETLLRYTVLRTIP
ncbi:Ca-activated chloride channel family protein [Lewinella marina]|uniref:Aerotolerance regulator BatA n=1 Tax=Neolewinella marina TaxID=438751 RepID=A0A2G0CEG5_9BACT|nr:VWA domain-containing protein [Neolewinella marina]NJB87326.1 Ca-activated chloride channel family protein [Neolewinella marina]PHK98355.1 aerotolerance regulator BatA [Neolewinella marina]